MRFSILDAVFTEIRILPCHQARFNPCGTADLEKLWAGLGTKLQQPVAKYVEVYEKAGPACVARMAHALHDCKFLNYSSQ